MASREDILKILANQEKPLHRQKIAEMLGETSYRPIQTGLNRTVEKKLATVNADNEYSITEEGLRYLSEGSEVAEGLNEETLGTTEYQQFIKLGKMTGVAPPELIVQTAEHVWAGGDFRDLVWVARAFQEMGIRQDLRNRWWHSWRSYFRQPMPSHLPPEIVEGEAAGAAKGSDTRGKKDKDTRSYILDPDDKVVYVGENLGDMYYDDAMELSKIRAGRGGRAATAAQTPGTMADDMVKMFNAFQTFMGDKAQGKSFMVRPGEEGIQVEEVDPGRPMILNYPQAGSKQPPAYFVNSEGEVQEVQPGQPIVIKQPAPTQPAGGVQYLIDKQTGQIQEVQPGHPIVIQSAPPQQQYPFTPIQMKDKDGNPMVLDLSTFIRLEEHRDKQRRDDESHEAKMELAKGFKDMLGKASTALGHVAEKK